MENTPTSAPSSLARLARSPRASLVIRILISIFILGVVFWTGMGVGFRKAEFSYHFSDRYFRAFGGSDRMPLGGMGMPDIDGLMGGHGATGRVLSINLPQVVVSDASGAEKTISIGSTTAIRSARTDVSSSVISIGDYITVIGDPDNTGSINARLIRIIPASAIGQSTSTTPLPPGGARGGSPRGPGPGYMR